MTTEHHRHTHHLDPQQLATIIEAINPPDAEPSEPTDCTHPDYLPAWSADGEAIFLDSQQKLRLVDPEFMDTDSAPATWKRLYTR